MGDEFSYRSPHAAAIASMYNEEPEKVVVSSSSLESSTCSDVMVSSVIPPSITVRSVVSEKFNSKYVPGSSTSSSSAEYKPHEINSIFSYKPPSLPPLPVVVSTDTHISSDHFTSPITPLQTLCSSSLSPTLIPSSTITSTPHHQLNNPNLGHPFGAYSEREVNILCNNHSLHLIHDEGLLFFVFFFKRVVNYFFCFRV
jgi:hypothetical protein